MSVTLLFLSFFAKFLAFFSCLTKRGSGTALPGYIVETKFINILAKFQHEYEEIIFISGTNGKTTTRAVLVEMYENSGFRVCTNRGGANIIRGIASSILLDLDIKAKPKSQILILEVEEASLPILTLYLQPKILILTNLFRDQLDAYAEIDKTLSYFEETLVNLGANEKEPLEVSNLPILEGFTQDGFYTQKLVKAAKFTLYLNYDDKKLLGLLDKFEIPSVGFSLDILESEKPKYEQAGRVISMPDETYLASNIVSKNLKTSFTVKMNLDKELLIETELPGIYNIYNIFVAFLVGYKKFGERVLPTIKKFQPVFGRGENIEINPSVSTKMFLVKNPAGFDQVLQLLASNFDRQEINLILAINDKIADGKDISWLWDTDFESFFGKQKVNKVLTTGSRGLDMLLRVEYAGLETNLNNFVEDQSKIIEFLKSTSRPTMILATYTAMLEIRKLLSKEIKLAGINSQGN